MFSLALLCFSTQHAARSTAKAITPAGPGETLISGLHKLDPGSGSVLIPSRLCADLDGGGGGGGDEQGDADAHMHLDRSMGAYRGLETT